MATLKSNIVIGVESSEHVEGAWQLSVTVPPLAVIEEIRAALGIDKYMGLIAKVLQSDGGAAFKSGEVSKAEMIRMLVSQPGADIAEITRGGLDRLALARLIEPYCGAPQGLDGIDSWQAMAKANESYYMAIMAVAARAVFDRCESDPAATEKKISRKP